MAVVWFSFHQCAKAKDCRLPEYDFATLFYLGSLMELDGWIAPLLWRLRLSQAGSPVEGPLTISREGQHLATRTAPEAPHCR